MIPYNPTYGNFRTRTFGDIFPSSEILESFRDEFSKICPTDLVSEDDLELIYALLLSKYAESHVAYKDEYQFKLRLLTMIGSHGPALLKNLEIQKKLLSMADDELITGTSIVMNHADHPATDPSTGSLEELQYIDQQNTSKTKRGKLEAYAFLNEMLDTDLYESFLNKFSSLFTKIVIPQEPLWYMTEV